MIFTMYLASSGDARPNKPRISTVFAAGPRAAAISRKVLLTSNTPTPCPAPSGKTSPATAPKSPCFLYAAVSAPSSFPASSATTRHNSAPPTCNVVSSQAGNARPERNTADTAASSGEQPFRYSATIPVFSSFLLVAAIASQVSASLRMDLLRCSTRIDEQTSLSRTPNPKPQAPNPEPQAPSPKPTLAPCV